MNKSASLFDLPYAPGRCCRRPGGKRRSLMEQIASRNQDFRCIRCKNSVSSDPIVAGVNNRNHCPYCLHSKHVDLLRSGDRLAACKAEMRPVGLTLKQRHKKYASEDSGELMLIHRCSDCGKVSINRIAADDDYDRIMEVYEKSIREQDQIRKEIENQPIRLLGPNDRSIVQRQLWGGSRS